MIKIELYLTEEQFNILSGLAKEENQLEPDLIINMINSRHKEKHQIWNPATRQHELCRCSHKPCAFNYPDLPKEWRD